MKLLTGRRFRAPACLLLAVLAVLPFPAYANAGLPMIFLTFPAMLIALLPIICIESLLMEKDLGIAIKNVVIPCGIANAVSTIAGFPLAWGLLLVLELATTGGGCGPGFATTTSSVLTVVLESAWLCPWGDQLSWMIPIAFINCLLVAFFISVFSEHLVLKKMLAELPQQQVKRVVYKANLVSYSLLILLNIGYLGFVISDRV